jgi:hypothetical protein
MPFENWDDTSRDLERALVGLEDREFLILGEPVPKRGPRRGIVHLAPTRYVQVLRIGEVLSAECVGDSLGGVWKMNPNLIERLCVLGWTTPAETMARYGTVTPNFDQYVDLEDLPALAGVLVATLQLLGALPHDLELQTQSGWAAERIG